MGRTLQKEVQVGVVFSAVWAGGCGCVSSEGLLSVELVGESCVVDVCLDRPCCIFRVHLGGVANSLRVECHGVAGQVWWWGLAEPVDERLLVASADWDVLDVCELECLLCFRVCWASCSGPIYIWRGADRVDSTFSNRRPRLGEELNT